MRTVAFALSLLAASSLTGCQSCQRASSEQQQPAIAPVAVPLPAAAVGELTIPDPARAWAALRDLLGGRFVAANLEMQLADTLGLSPLAAGSFVIQVPIRGVLLQQPEAPSWVWAVRVRSGAELVALLTKGSNATFSAQPLPTGETLLVPKVAPLKLGATDQQLAVLDNFLLVATRRDALMIASRYLVQPDRGPAPPVGAGASAAPYVELSINQQGLKQAGSEPLRQAWEAQRSTLALLLDQQIAAQGRPADYADPANVLKVIEKHIQRTLDIVAGFSHASLRLSEHQGGLALILDLKAPAGSAARQWFSELSRGQPPTWATVSSTARGVLSLALANPEASAWGQSASRGFQDLFAERLSAADLKRVEAAFTTLANGLGPCCTWGWQQIDAGSAVFLTTQVRDATAFRAGLASLFELRTVPAVSKIMAGYLEGTRLQPLKLNIAGDAVEGFQFRTRSGPGSAVLWAVHGDRGHVVWGPASELALKELLAPAQTLGDQPALQAILAGGRTVTNPALLIYGNSPELGGVVAFAGLTGTENGGELRLQVNRAMIQSAIPWLVLLLAAP